MRKPAAVVSAIFVAALCLVTSPSASAGNTTWSVRTDGLRHPRESPLAHAIVFTRFLPGADTGSVYRIDAGTTVEHLIRSGVLDSALLSPDATQIADVAFTSEGADHSHLQRGRIGVPACTDLRSRHTPERAAGSHMVRGRDQDRRGSGRPGEHPTEWHLLQAFIRRQRGDPADRRRDSIRLSGDVLAGWVETPVLPTRRKERDERQRAAGSVRGRRQRRGRTRPTPRGTTTAVVFSYDSVSWSPDGTKVAVAAAREPFWNTSIHSVYVASADGSSFKRVGPRGTSGMRSGRRTVGGSRSQWPPRERVACSSST